MSSAMAGTSDRKRTRRPGRKAPSLRPDTNTSVTAGGRVVTPLQSSRSAAKMLHSAVGIRFHQLFWLLVMVCLTNVTFR